MTGEMGIDPFQKRALGRQGLRVTQLGLGTAPIGELYARISDDEACKTIRSAYDAGVRYFDTAPLYGHGLSEHRTGYALRRYPRDSYVLSTKVGRGLKPLHQDFDPGIWAGGLRFAPFFDYTHDGIMRQVEDSLQRLGTERIDTLAIHDLDRIHHPDGNDLERRFQELESSGLAALHKLRDEGVISGYGAGVNQIRFALRFLERTDLDFFLIAGRYTILDQVALEEVLPACLRRRITITVAGPYNSGILATGPTPGAKYDYETAPPEILEKTRRIESVCREFQVPLAAAALQFPLAHPAVTSVIPGAFSVRESRQNVALMGLAIPVQLWSRLKEEGLLPEEAPTFT